MGRRSDLGGDADPAQFPSHHRLAVSGLEARVIGRPQLQRERRPVSPLS